VVVVMPNAQLIWSDEFTRGLAFADDAGAGVWRMCGSDASVMEGYSDLAGSSWNCSRDQAEEYGLVTVADSVLTLQTKRNPGIRGVGNAWIGVHVVSNGQAGLTWTMGYFEFRARFPNPARGMFPALWLYNEKPPNGKESAEIDLLEIFGSRAGRPWETSLHGVPTTRIGGHNDDDTTRWHRYGLEWTDTALRTFVDGVYRAEVTGPDAAWFSDVPMTIRMDYVMDPSWNLPGGEWPDPSRISTENDPPPGTEPRMEIDYVRVYDCRPDGLPTSAADPMWRL
jgi:hypothetical protein